MIVIGLTGSIGMGKSVLARQLRAMNIPVHDADAAVHRLLEPGGAGVAPVARAFPTVRIGTGKAARIDRKKLGQIVFADAHARKKLEKILHPLVRAASNRFLRECRRKGRKAAVLDIPLLYETRQQRRFDHILCVSAPYFVQNRRVVSRSGMTESRLRAILKLQMPDAIKRARADTVINTARGYRFTRSKVKRVIKRLARERMRKT